MYFKGAIIVQGPNYAEELLEFLITDGYEGKALVNEFNSRMESKEDFRKDDEE